MSGVRSGAGGVVVWIGVKNLVIDCSPCLLAQMVVAATFLYRGPKTLIQSFRVEVDCCLDEVEFVSCC